MREYDALVRQTSASRVRTLVLLVSLSALLFLWLGSWLRLLLEMSSPIGRQFVLIPMVANAAAWTLWAMQLYRGLFSRGDLEFRDRSSQGLRILDEVQYQRYRLSRESR